MLLLAKSCFSNWSCTERHIRQILNAPPVNPRVYICQYYIIDPKEGLNFFLFLDKPRSYITVNLIFYTPNNANLGFWKIVPTIAL